MRLNVECYLVKIEKDLISINRNYNASTRGTFLIFKNS